MRYGTNKRNGLLNAFSLWSSDNNEREFDFSSKRAAFQGLACSCIAPRARLNFSPRATGESIRPSNQALQQRDLAGKLRLSGHDEHVEALCKHLLLLFGGSLRQHSSEIVLVRNRGTRGNVAGLLLCLKAAFSNCSPAEAGREEAAPVEEKAAGL